jgi:hypothetical protein
MEPVTDWAAPQKVTAGFGRLPEGDTIMSLFYPAAEKKGWSRGHFSEKDTGRGSCS